MSPKVDDATQVIEAGERALERLRRKEEILQICYWYQGEGFGSVFMPQSVVAFLDIGLSEVTSSFDELVEAGDLERGESGFTFTPTGKRKAARMFVEGFTDFQQPGHGECVDGCCEGDEPGSAQRLNCPHATPFARAKGDLICDRPTEQ